MSHENNKRAMRVIGALEAYTGQKVRALDPEDLDDAMRDFLADLRHFSDYNFFDFGDIDGRAQEHYREEVGQFGVARPGSKDWQPGRAYP